MTDKITAKQLLEETNKLFPDLKHIAKDLNGEVWFWEIKPNLRYGLGLWTIKEPQDFFYLQFSPELSKDIDWGTDNWTECICSLN